MCLRADKGEGEVKITAWKRARSSFWVKNGRRALSGADRSYRCAKRWRGEQFKDWHTLDQPCLESEMRQGRSGGKDHDVQTGKICLVIDREECGVNVNN